MERTIFPKKQPLPWKKILLWLLLAGWMCVIFFFSAQDAESSSLLSSGFLHRFVLVFLPEKLAADRQLVHTLEFLIRKAAHMTEYAVLAMLALAQIRQYVLPYASEAENAGNTKIAGNTENAGKTRVNALHRPLAQCFCALCFVFLYACTDEFHQLFSDGRSGQIKDVLIDTFGGLFGVLFYLFCARLYRKIRQARPR